MAIIKMIILLSIALYWALFCIYNTGSIAVYVPGLKEMSLPLSLFVFVIFLCGVFVAAFLAFIDQFHQWSRIKKMKRKIGELEQNKQSPDEIQNSQQEDATGRE